MTINSGIDIEQELQRLHKQNEEQGKQTACLFNLIIYAHEPRRVAYFERVLTNILDKFPCRVIFIQELPDTTGVLKIQVSTVGVTIGEEEVCCDRITIQVSESEKNALAFLITPNLASDLPVFLVWGRNPCDQDPVLPDLLKMTTRLIVDSECSGDIGPFSRRILEWIASKKVAIIDMNWAFISGWRDVLSQVFTSEGKLQELSKVTSVRIAYNALQTPEAIHSQKQALYFQAWLGARLKWTFVASKSEERKIFYQSANGSVEVELIPLIKEELIPGAIVSVELATAQSEFSFQRIGSIGKMLVHVTVGDHCEVPMTVSLPNVRGGITFQREVFYGPPSPQYPEMLDFLSDTHIEECSL